MRQMKEYKRQKKDAEDRFLELNQKTQHLDVHLRVTDAWWTQLLDELRVLASQMLPTPPPSATPAAGMTSLEHHVRRYNTETLIRRGDIQVRAVVRAQRGFLGPLERTVGTHQERNIRSFQPLTLSLP